MPPPVPSSAAARGAVHAATLLELRDAHKLSSALVPARLIDSGDADTDSALASVTREWRATLEAAVGGAQAAEDPLDEIARKRAERMARLTAGG